MTRSLPILALGLAALAGPAAALFAAPPREGVPVLVILPRQDRAAILAAAGAVAVGPIEAPLAVLAQGDGADLAARLMAAGAWAVRDGTALARLCGV